MTNLVHGGEQRELCLEPLAGQQVVHLGRGLGALQLLPVQHVRLQLHYRLLPHHKCLSKHQSVGIVKVVTSVAAHLGHLPVPAAVAGRDQVRHAARLEVGGVVTARVECVAVSKYF